MSPAGHASTDDTRTVAFFTEQVRRHAGTPAAVDWSSRAGQELRFRILAEVGLTPGCSVLDVGCGQGDLLGWLRGQGLEVAYAGVDITPAMVEQARRQHPGGDFRLLPDGGADLGERTHDFVLASGIFYRRATNPMGFLADTAARLLRAARVAAAFNCLSLWGGPAEEGEFKADPLAVLAACRAVTPHLALRHDYHTGDFTLYLRRERLGA